MMENPYLSPAASTDVAQRIPIATPWDWAIATLVGVILAVVPFEITPLPSMAWFAVLVSILWCERGKQQGSRGFARVSIQVVVVIAILAAAAYAPVKEVDRLLAESIVLPGETMTIGEIEDFSSTANAGLLEKARIYAETEEVRDIVIRFTDTNLPLRDFIDHVEQQTGFRHHWVSCGNSSTFLWGIHPGAISFWIESR